MFWRKEPLPAKEPLVFLLHVGVGGACCEVSVGELADSLCCEGSVGELTDSLLFVRPPLLTTHLKGVKPAAATIDCESAGSSCASSRYDTQPCMLWALLMVLVSHVYEHRARGEDPKP